MSEHAGERRQRWYGSRPWTAGRQMPWQTHYIEPTIPEAIARLAHQEYERHHQQSFERLHERGGFGVSEVICLLADRVEHLEAVQNGGSDVRSEGAQ